MLVLTDPRAPPGHVHRVVYASEWVKRSLAHDWHNSSAAIWTRDPSSDTWTKVPTATYGGSGAARVWHIEGQVTLEELAEWFAAGKPTPSGARMGDPDGFICTPSNGDTPCPRPKKFCVVEGCWGFRVGTKYCYYHASPAPRKKLSRAGKVRERKHLNALKLKVKKVRKCKKCKGYERGYEDRREAIDALRRRFDFGTWQAIRSEYLRSRDLKKLPRWAEKKDRTHKCETTPETKKGEVTWCALWLPEWQKRDRPRTDIALREARPPLQPKYPDRHAKGDWAKPAMRMGEPTDDEASLNNEPWDRYSYDRKTGLHVSGAWETPWDIEKKWAEKQHFDDAESPAFINAAQRDDERRFRRQLAALSFAPERRPRHVEKPTENFDHLNNHAYDKEKWPDQHDRLQAEIRAFRKRYLEMEKSQTSHR